MATVYEYKGVSYELPDGLTNEATQQIHCSNSTQFKTTSYRNF